MHAIDPKIRRWTRSEYHRIAETGVFDHQRVELIDGEVVQMSPHGHYHALAIMLANEALTDAFGKGFVVRVQLPLVAGIDSEPEPDLAVVAGSPRQITRHPECALLVVEVGDSTVDFDLGRKASLYAACGVADYWVIDVTDKKLVTHRDPVEDPATEFGRRYGEVRVLNSSDRIAPLARPDSVIRVADLLP